MAVGTLSSAPNQINSTPCKLGRRFAKTASSVTLRIKPTSRRASADRKTYSVSPGKVPTLTRCNSTLVADKSYGPTSARLRRPVISIPAPRLRSTSTSGPSRSAAIGWPGTGTSSMKTVDHFGGKKAFGVFRERMRSPLISFPVKELHWAGVNDQFFTTIDRTRDTAYEARSLDQPFSLSPSKATRSASREKADVRLRSRAQPAQKRKSLQGPRKASASVSFEIYLGPKEFARLKSLGDRRQRGDALRRGPHLRLALRLGDQTASPPSSSPVSSSSKAGSGDFGYLPSS
jgi:hypothetical protein